MELLLILAAFILAGLTWFLGLQTGKAKGRAEGDERAAHSEEQARKQAVMHNHDSIVLKDNQQRLLELIVNLPETVNRMGAARSTSALCRISVRALMDLVGARRVGLFLAAGAPPRFTLEVFAGSQRPEKKITFDIGTGKLGRLAEWIGVRSEGDLVVGRGGIDGSLADELFKPDLCISIRRHDKIYAFVAMDGIERDDPMTRRVIQMLADIHAVSAEGLAILHKERAKADLDQLTGLFNRRHLDRRLAEEMARAQAYGTQLSIFLFDIDNFKHFNDTNGHQAGDLCLQKVSGLTRRVTRGSDIVCRYGGEEFLVILLGTDRQEAIHHAERIRRSIAEADIEHAESQPLGCVSVSGGVACYPDDASQPETLLSLADRALYLAKDSGRNQVLSAVNVDVNGDREGNANTVKAETTARRRELVTPPPPTYAPIVMNESPIQLVQEGIRGADPIHTPLPMRIGNETPPAVHVPQNDGPSPAHTPIPGFSMTPVPRSMPTQESRYPPITPPPRIRVAPPNPDRALVARDSSEAGVYTMGESKKVDRTR